MLNRLEDNSIKEFKEESFNNDLYINKKIFYYKGIIKNHKDILEKIEDLGDPWNFYSTKATEGQPYEKSSYQFTEYKKINIEDIKEILDACIQDYEIKNNVKIKKFTDMVVHRSYPGKHLGPHCDSHGDSNSPYITVMVDLNDNYVGGELAFDKQDLVLKPAAGSILIYPCVEPYSHLPNLISAGSKTSILLFGFKDEDN